MARLGPGCGVSTGAPGCSHASPRGLDARSGSRGPGLACGLMLLAERPVAFTCHVVQRGHDSVTADDLTLTFQGLRANAVLSRRGQAPPPPADCLRRLPHGGQSWAAAAEPQDVLPGLSGRNLLAPAPNPPPPSPLPSCFPGPEASWSPSRCWKSGSLSTMGQEAKPPSFPYANEVDRHLLREAITSVQFAFPLCVGVQGTCFAWRLPAGLAVLPRAPWHAGG